LDIYYPNTYALPEYFATMCDAKIRLPAFQPGKCRCRTGGLNKKEKMPNFVGTQCRFTAGENGLCSQHNPDHKFGFYDEPRPTRWGFTHDGRRIPLPASEENKRGKPIPWKKNVILPGQRATPNCTAQQESDTSKYLSELRILKQGFTKVISDQQAQIDLLKKQLEESEARAIKAESKSVSLQLTVDKQKGKLQELQEKLKRVFSIFSDDKDEYEAEDEAEAEDEVSEDTKLYDVITFEGVEYQEEEETGDIYNEEYQRVGKWNDDCDDIIWISPEFKTAHENNPSRQY